MNIKSLKSRRILLYVVLIILFFSDVIAYGIFINAAKGNYSELTLNRYEVLDNIVKYIKTKSVDYNSLYLTLKSEIPELDMLITQAGSEQYYIGTSKDQPVMIKGESMEKAASMLKNMPVNEQRRYFLNNRDVYVYTETISNEVLYMVISFNVSFSNLNSTIKMLYVYKLLFLIALIATGLFLLYSIEKPLKAMAESAGKAGIKVSPDDPERLYKLFSESIQSIRNGIEEDNRMSSEARERLERMERDILELRSLEALSSISDGIAHQLNNNLASIKGSIQIYRKNHDPAVLQRMESDIDSMINFTGKFLEFSRPVEPYLEMTNISELLLETTARFITDTEHLNIEKDVHAMTDRVLLEQVLLNFLDNAVKYSDTEPDVTLVNLPSAVRITIKDHGRGFPQSILTEPYKPFSPEAKGYGLGIPTAYKILGLLGHKISIENEQDGGRVIIDIGRSQ